MFFLFAIEIKRNRWVPGHHRQIHRSCNWRGLGCCDHTMPEIIPKHGLSCLGKAEAPGLQAGSSGLSGSDGVLLPPPQPRRTLGLHPMPKTTMNLEDFIDSFSPPTSVATTPARSAETKVVEFAFSPQTLSAPATIQSAAVTPARADKAQTQELLQKSELYSAPAAISSAAHAKLQSVSSKYAPPSLPVLPPPPARAAPRSHCCSTLNSAPGELRRVLPWCACACATSRAAWPASWMRAGRLR